MPLVDLRREYGGEARGGTEFAIGSQMLLDREVLRPYLAHDKCEDSEENGRDEPSDLTDPTDPTDPTNLELVAKYNSIWWSKQLRRQMCSITPDTHALHQPTEVDTEVQFRECSGVRCSIPALVQAGDAIIFDYRTFHRGLPNVSTVDRPVVYAVFARAGHDDQHNFTCEYQHDFTSTTRPLWVHTYTYSTVDCCDECGFSVCVDFSVLQHRSLFSTPAPTGHAQRT
jgi:hypothetical protein